MPQRPDTCGRCGAAISQPSGAGRPRKYCSERCRKPRAVRSTAIAYNVCDQCGRLWVSLPSRAQRFCSSACHGKSQRRRFVCGHCGEEFTRDGGRSGERRYCSLACFLAKKAKPGTQLSLIPLGAHARRERRRRSEIHWSDIAERDGYRCHLCGEKVRTGCSDESGFDPRGPSVDHLVPRSHGGPDSLNNVRLACRACNSERKDALLEDVAAR